MLLLCDGCLWGWAKRHAKPFSRFSWCGLAGSTCAAVIGAAALAGCGLSSDPGSYLVDPGKFSAMHCKDLIAQWNALVKREADLRNLQAKASEGGGGSVIGSIAYRPDFESVLTQQKLVQREALEQKCELTPSYQSDQSIR